MDHLLRNPLNHHLFSQVLSNLDLHLVYPVHNHLDLHLHNQVRNLLDQHIVHQVHNLLDQLMDNQVHNLLDRHMVHQVHNHPDPRLHHLVLNPQDLLIHQTHNLLDPVLHHNHLDLLLHHNRQDQVMDLRVRSHLDLRMVLPLHQSDPLLALVLRGQKHLLRFNREDQLNQDHLYQHQLARFRQEQDNPSQLMDRHHLHHEDRLVRSLDQNRKVKALELEKRGLRYGSS